MSNVILRLYGHAALFAGVVGVGFALMVLTINPTKFATWGAGLVCLLLVVLGVRTIQAA
ncbi:hypothetical protein [Haladaptatus sp. DYF46]|uniref:hypothetical protein n=1 Tax=unclassified Haladaptatus TaxID=2622732 RepID=UPI001E3BFDA9|nr:hypothetical protein [Haladaptatus sp. DYF46]